MHSKPLDFMQIERKYAIGFDSEWDVVAVRDMVRDAHRVVMVAHTNADGDAVGSVTGMYQLLCQIGVAMVTPMLPDGVPDEVSWSAVKKTPVSAARPSGQPTSS